MKKNEYLYSIEGKRIMLLNKLSLVTMQTRTQGCSASNSVTTSLWGEVTFNRISFKYFKVFN
jgi:hypothetical protein